MSTNAAPQEGAAVAESQRAVGGQYKAQTKIKARTITVIVAGFTFFMLAVTQSITLWAGWLFRVDLNRSDLPWYQLMLLGHWPTIVLLMFVVLGWHLWLVFWIKKPMRQQNRAYRRANSASKAKLSKRARLAIRMVWQSCGVTLAFLFAFAVLFTFVPRIIGWHPAQAAAFFVGPTGGEAPLGLAGVAINFLLGVVLMMCVMYLLPTPQSLDPDHPAKRLGWTIACNLIIWVLLWILYGVASINMIGG